MGAFWVQVEKKVRKSRKTVKHKKALKVLILLISGAYYETPKKDRKNPNTRSGRRGRWFESSHADLEKQGFAKSQALIFIPNT